MQEENAITTQFSSAVIEVEKSRAMQEVKAQIHVAKMYPRDEILVIEKIIKSCRRTTLADVAMYSYPRAGQTVTGPSIRLAEELARAYGNLKYGFKEIESDKDKATIKTYAWDLENNVYVEREFDIVLKVFKKDGSFKILTDPRDKYEHVASQAQRRVRAAILEIIPGDIVEKAVQECERTLKEGINRRPLIDQIKEMVIAFGEIGVSREMLEIRAEMKAEQFNAEKIAEFRKIFLSLKDGITKRADWFQFEDRASKSTGLKEELAKEVINEQKK